MPRKTGIKSSPYRAKGKDYSKGTKKGSKKSKSKKK